MRATILILFALLYPGCRASGSIVVDVSALPAARALELDILTATRTGDEEALCGELSSGAIGIDDTRLSLLRRLTFGVDEESPELGLLPLGRTIFLVLARSEAPRCPAVGIGCVVQALEDGRSVAVEVVVDPLPSPLPCPADRSCTDAFCGPCLDGAECGDDDPCTDDRCEAGSCVHDAVAGCLPCAGDEECDDDDPCTVDSCASGRCLFALESPRDHDGDEHALDECGGDDCDDDDAQVHAGADRRCGSGVDHDCDGTIDDAQGCGPCVPTDLATFGLPETIAVDARDGLFVVGTEDPSSTEELMLYALSPTEIQVVAVRREGGYRAMGTTSHGANNPLPPVVVGEHLVLVEIGDPSRLMVFTRDALAEGTAGSPVVLEDPPWGRPRSIFVTDRTLYVTTWPTSLWAVDLDDLPEVPEPTGILLNDGAAWGDCADMARAGDYLLCVEAMESTSTLSVAELVAPHGAVPVNQFSLDQEEATDLEAFPDLQGGAQFGLAQRTAGLTLVIQESLAWDDWSWGFQDALIHLAFPLPFCGETSTCEWAKEIAAFGPEAAVVLTRDDHLASPGTLRLYLVNLVAPAMPTAVNGVAVSDPAPVPGREEHLFVSGSLVFVATSPIESDPVVKLYRVDCDG
jgi:hypothetical protein